MRLFFLVGMYCYCKCSIQKVSEAVVEMYDVCTDE